MKYYTIPPPPELQEFVRFFWVLEHDVPPASEFVYRSMADGCAEILFHYRGRFDEVLKSEKKEASFLSGIHGQSRCFRRFSIERGFGIFGVYLYPYALPALFGIPAAEVSDGMPDLESVFGGEGRDLEEKMMSAADNICRTQIFATFVKSRLRKQQPLSDPTFLAVRTLLECKGVVSIRDMASQYCLSTRQFERKFKLYAGFNPKLYARVVRFQSVFQEFDVSSSPFSEIAYKCGYYDQSHFIQDFKEFSGYSPKQFFAGNSSDTTIWSE